MQKHIQHLIIQGETEEALENLLFLSRKIKNSNLEDEISLHFARYKEYETAKQEGIITKEEQDIFFSKINKSLLSILRKLPDQTTKNIQHKNQAFSPTGKKKKQRWFLAAVGILLFCIAIPISIVTLPKWYSTRKVQSEEAPVINNDSLLQSKQPLTIKEDPKPIRSKLKGKNQPKTSSNPLADHGIDKTVEEHDKSNIEAVNAPAKKLTLLIPIIEVDSVSINGSNRNDLINGKFIEVDSGMNSITLFSNGNYYNTFNGFIRKDSCLVGGENLLRLKKCN